jgi:hypothetical protein
MGNLVESIARICVELFSGDLEIAARIADHELSTSVDFKHHVDTPRRNRHGCSFGMGSSTDFQATGLCYLRSYF